MLLKPLIVFAGNEAFSEENEHIEVNSLALTTTTTQPSTPVVQTRRQKIKFGTKISSLKVNQEERFKNSFNEPTLREITSDNVSTNTRNAGTKMPKIEFKLVEDTDQGRQDVIIVLIRVLEYLSFLSDLLSYLLVISQRSRPRQRRWHQLWSSDAVARGSGVSWAAPGCGQH